MYFAVIGGVPMWIWDGRGCHGGSNYAQQFCKLGLSGGNNAGLENRFVSLKTVHVNRAYGEDSQV